MKTKITGQFGETIEHDVDTYGIEHVTVATETHDVSELRRRENAKRTREWLLEVVAWVVVAALAIALGVALAR